MLLKSLTTPLVLLGLLATSLAGCLSLPDDAPSWTSGNQPGASGAMTAEESVAEQEGVEPRVPPRYYAERVVTVEGILTFERLPVTASTVNGNVDVRAGTEGEWRLVVTMRGSGTTPEEARANLDRLTLEWSHESGGDHYIKAVVKDERRRDGDGGRSAHVSLEVPPSLLMSLSASTANGAVSVERVRAERLSASTANGLVSVDASDVGSATLASTNGNVKARIRPGTNGGISAESTNGNVEVAVPEEARFGYDARLSTVNGRTSVGLQDGTSTSSGQYGPRSMTFRTDGYEARPVRVSMTVTTVNGNVALVPL